jgi:winged helix DNA-binding protein
MRLAVWQPQEAPFTLRQGKIYSSTMTRLDIVRHRLHNQRISTSPLGKPSEVVRWLGAVQAQDYAGAKWALGLRLRRTTDANIEQAVADGSILRTHVLRPTWHFVAPEDIRWLLALTAPRIHAANAHYYRSLELDKALFARSSVALVKALRDGQQLTRAELASVLRQAGIKGSGLRLVYLIGSAELDGIICSGARRGKQFTYALLDDRVPPTKTLERDEALAELARRYFTSHGPATEEDFMWWSGLTRADIRSGLEMVKQQMAYEVIDGKTYWFAASGPLASKSSQAAFLLPNYDEYIVGYTDRTAIFDSSHSNKLDARGNPLFQHTIVVKGRIVGTWKRILKKQALVIETNLFTQLTKAEDRSVAAAIQQYGEFLELPVVRV